MKLFLYLSLFCLSNILHASPFEELLPYFENEAQKAQKLFQKGDFKQAAVLFKDPYRQGVALYKAKQYKAAKTKFEQVSRPEVLADALYNLGNTHIQLKEYEQAIKAFEKALKLNPDNEEAYFNLAISRTMLAQTDPEKINTEEKSSLEEKEEEKKSDKDKPSDKNKKNGEKSGTTSNKNKEGKEGKNKMKKEGQNQEQETLTAKLKEKISHFLNPISKQMELSQFEQKQDDLEQPSKQDEQIKENLDIPKPMEDWLKQIEGDPTILLQNLFRIEEQRLQKEGIQHELRPW